jgi:hypothetical protein
MKLLTLVGDLFSLLGYEMDGNLYPGKDFSRESITATRHSMSILFQGDRGWILDRVDRCIQD